MMRVVDSEPRVSALGATGKEAHELARSTHRFVREIEARVSHLGEHTAFAQLRALVGKIDRLYRDCAGQAAVLENAFAGELNTLVHESAFCRYAHDKPRGYPGDFEAMEMIWRGHTDPIGARYVGTTVRGKLINAFTLDSDNCRANVARVHRFQQLLCELPGGRVASVGSGSAIEIDEAFAFGCEALDVHLFDQDVGALKAARDRLQKHRASVHYNHGNVLRTILRPSRDRYDLVYSAGMFDYFSVDAARRLTAALWKKVAPGGRLIITNAHPDNPTRAWMELVAGWRLVYKDTDQMHSLASDLEQVATTRVEYDSERVYQYLTVQRA